MVSNGCLQRRKEKRGKKTKFKGKKIEFNKLKIQIKIFLKVELIFPLFILVL